MAAPPFKRPAFKPKTWAACKPEAIEALPMATQGRGDTLLTVFCSGDKDAVNNKFIPAKFTGICCVNPAAVALALLIPKYHC